MHLVFYSKHYNSIYLDEGFTKIFDSHLWIPSCITSETLLFPWILLQFTRYSFPTTDMCSDIPASITSEFALADALKLRVHKMSNRLAVLSEPFLCNDLRTQYWIRRNRSPSSLQLVYELSACSLLIDLWQGLNSQSIDSTLWNPLSVSSREQKQSQLKVQDKHTQYF